MSADHTASDAKVSPPDLTDWAPGEGMRLLGWLLIVVGLSAVAISWFLPTTVEIGPSFAAGEYLAPREVANLARQQIQLIVLYCGLGLWLGGLALYCTSRVIGEIARAAMGR